MFGIRRARAAMRLNAANRAFAKAYAARISAERRRDSRDLHYTRSALQRARAEQMAAELAYAALAPKPLHA
ncbi:hypothetical protein [Brevundimonas sp.]|uniref:hypothetical protein n=1 Tax=Brevundimonas sp. TaxID=1871086 RepID=UPI00289E4BCF|nr:hypothetical protein [Brevundimonas sp.]